MIAETIWAAILAYALAYFLAGIFFGEGDSHHSHTGGIWCFFVTFPFIAWLLYA